MPQLCTGSLPQVPARIGMSPGRVSSAKMRTWSSRPTGAPRAPVRTGESARATTSGSPKSRRYKPHSKTLPVRVSERSTSDDHADEIRPCRGRVPQAPRPHRDVRRLSRRYAVLNGCPARPRLAGGSPMMCDRCDQPIDPGDAKPYEVPGATGPGVTVYLCRSAATCCRRSARKRTRTRLAADLPPVPGRRRPGARRARSSSVSWASRSCAPVARLLALAFRWFPRDVAAERSSFGHSWPLPGALGRAPTAPSEARAPLQEFDRADVAPGSARTPTPCRIGQGCYSLSSCQRRMADAPAVECGCGGGPWPCVRSWRADPERQP